MKIDVVYTCVTEGERTLSHITKFIATHHVYPGNEEHRVVPVFNGGPAKLVQSIPFSGLNHSILTRSNEGWDIGGYIEAAHTVCSDADIMVCFGESVYFHRAGWLSPIVEAWKVNGEGMYGAFGSNVVRPHLQTTAFITSPRLLREYPMHVSTKKDRYEFEHGKRSFMSFVESKSLPVSMVTFEGCFRKHTWRIPRNVIWSGDQSSCLVWCNHSDNYLKSNPRTRELWKRFADGVNR